VRRDRQSGGVDRRWTVGCDATGRIASFTLDMRTITLEYDASGRQVRQRDGRRVAKIAYDAQGRRGRLAQTKRNDNTKTLLFAYDEEDRLLRAELWLGRHQVSPLRWNRTDRLLVDLEQQAHAVAVVSLGNAYELSSAETRDTRRPCCAEPDAPSEGCP